MAKSPEQFPEANATPGASKETAPSEVESFFDKEAEILGAYGMRGDIEISRGNNGWAFDFQNRKLIYDPNFFVERGYNLKETLFATTHELMAHYGELLRDPEFVLKEAKRYTEQKPQLHVLYNIFEDVLGNRRIVAELPFLEETRSTLYKEKMFPATDYRKLKDPRTGEEQELSSHVQFVYGFIRQMMVPGEKVTVGPEAQEALDKLRNFGDDRTDILDLVTTPGIEPRDRFKLMRQVVEPVYLELYRRDLEKETQKQGGGQNQESQEQPSGGPQQEGKPREQQGEGKKDKKWWERLKKKKGSEKGADQKEKAQDGGGKKKEREKEAAARREAEKKFGEQYRTYEETHPEPLSQKDEEKIMKTIEEIVKEKGGKPSLDRSILEQWAREHDVSPEDVIGYRNEYEDIAPLIAELREVFKKIVMRRLQKRWKVKPQLEREGEEIEGGAVAEAYVESKSGGEPRAFREMERKEREEEGYGALDMSLINDLSGSMNEGSKLNMDRKSKLLFLESLADFQKEIEEAEYENGASLGLGVRTETRAFGDFGDAELKKLSPELSEKDRIGIWKRLHQAGGGTPDYLSLEAIMESLTPKEEQELKEKIRRKVLVVLSDGDSENAERVQKALTALRAKGIIVLGLGMTESGQAVRETYKPDAEVIEDINKLPQAVQKVILQYTKDL